MRRLLALAALTLLLTGCAVETDDSPGSSVQEGGGPTADAPAGGGDAGSDVTVTGCNRGEFGLITAVLSVMNSQDTPQSYLVTVSADGPDGVRVAELNAAANSIQPGQTASVEAVGSVTGEAPEGLTCTVVNVNRF